MLQGHNYPQHPVPGVLAMTLFAILISPLFTLVRDRSGSVLAAAGLAALALLNLGIHLYGRRTGGLDAYTKETKKSENR